MKGKRGCKMERSVPFPTWDSLALWDRSGSKSGFPSVTYLFSQAVEGSRFLLTQLPEHDLQIA